MSTGVPAGSGGGQAPASVPSRSGSSGSGPSGRPAAPSASGDGDLFGVTDSGAASPDPFEVEGEGGDGGPADQLSDAELAAAEADRQDRGEEAEGERFRLGEFEFDSPEQAANEFKRALGRLKAEGQRSSELRQYAQQAINTALAWQQWGQQLGGSGSPGSPSSVASGDGGPAEGALPEVPDLASFADNVDWEQVSRVQDEYGSTVAMNYLMRKLSRASAEYAKALTEQAVAPYKESHQQAQMLSGLESLFEQAAVAQESQDGPALYPELALDGNGNFVNEDVGEIVIELFKEHVADGFPPGPRTVHAAVLEFRRLAQLAGASMGIEVDGVTSNHPQSGSPRNGGAGVGAQIRERLARSSEARSAVTASRGGAPLRARRGPVSPGDELDADFERAKKRTNPVFGVAR